MDGNPSAVYWLTDPMERDLVKLVLIRAGFDPISCYDLEDIQKAIRSSKPGLIIMDIVLPGENGLEVTRTIKETHKRASPLIILVSALAFPEVVAQVREAGADDFIVKPIDGNLLFDRVRNLIKK